MAKNIRIDILLAVGERGGVETVVNKNALYLQQRGMQVRVIQFVWEGVRWVADSVPFYPLLEGRGSYTIDQFVAKYTEFLAMQEKPDIILATAWPMMVLIARMSIVKMKLSCKIVSWLHAPIDRYVAAGYGGIECLEKADEIFVLTERSRNIIHTYNPELCIRIVRNPVDFSRCSALPEADRSKRTLLYVGRLSEEKRVETIIQALCKTKERWDLRIVGDGEVRDRLETLVCQSHLEEQVHFQGWKPDPWEYAEDVSALVLASEYEGFPVAAIEAMACGIPVISTPVDGIIEIIRPGVNGFLFPKGDSTALSDVLDAVSSGQMPPIQPQTVRETVADYEEQKVLVEFREEILGVLDKISVIIPCYNVEKQIARCLDSILNQILHGARMEIICIDDKSTDNTLHILEEYERKFPENIMLIPLDENGKQGNARNIGMMYADGAYITFVDADDAIAPDMLQVLYEKAVDSRCDIAECAYKEVYGNAPLSVEKKGGHEYMDMHDANERKRYILQYGWKVAPWGRLYRRDFLEDNHIRFPTDIYMEDIYFSELCMMKMNSYVRVPDTYYFYCINAAGVMCSDGILSYYMDTAKVQNMTTEFVLKQGLASHCMYEYAYLHFSKAFAEPVMRMCRDIKFLSYNNFQYLKKTLLQFFPDFLQNPYVKKDDSEEMEWYELLLQGDYSEEELYKMISEYGGNRSQQPSS